MRRHRPHTTEALKRSWLAALFACAGLMSWPGHAAANLAFLQDLQQGVAGTDGLNDVRALATSPDGKHVYAASFAESAVTRFDRDTATGRLTFGAVLSNPSNLAFATAVTVSRDGKNVYVPAHNTSAMAADLIVLTRNLSTGALTFLESQVQGMGGVDGLTDGVSVLVSPDGKHVYVVALTDSAVSVFGRDSATGALTFVEVQKQGTGGVTGMDQPSEGTITSDGAHLYIASPSDNSIAIFSRNPTTGALTFVGNVQNGVAGVTGIVGASAVAVSPDAQYVYVGGNGDVAVFQRNAITGLLSEVQVPSRGGGPMALSSDGNFAYAFDTTTSDPAIDVFRRDSGTGFLTFVEDHVEGQGGVFGLNGDHGGLAITSDGSSLYGAANTDDAIAVFRRLHVDCPATPVSSGCKLPTASKASTLTLKNDVIDTKDTAVWKWAKGAAATLGDFGDPINTFEDYTLCIYDGAGGDQPRLRTDAPGDSTCKKRPCWKSVTRGSGGFSYSSTARYPDGTGKLTLSAGAVGQAKATTMAKGVLLHLPTLPLMPPVRAQLLSAGGLCLEATYSTPTQNDAGQFKAKSD
jgi:6-phosphogluconolactonase (cycloisomerase 2 family)